MPKYPFISFFVSAPSFTPTPNKQIFNFLWLVSIKFLSL